MGDSDGCVHLLSRQLKCERLPAFARGPVTALLQLRQSALLLALGEEDKGSHFLKVFDLDRRDKQGAPTLLR